MQKKFWNALAIPLNSLTTNPVDFSKNLSRRYVPLNCSMKSFIMNCSHLFANRSTWVYNMHGRSFRKRLLYNGQSLFSSCGPARIFNKSLVLPSIDLTFFEFSCACLFRSKQSTYTGINIFMFLNFYSCDIKRTRRR